MFEHTNLSHCSRLIANRYVFGSVYNASKAALHAYSNTLRVEMSPFGVKVVTIVTGGVKSRIARVERQLPADSIYVTVNDEYQRRTKHSQEVGMPNEKYAKSVVSQLLKKNPRKFVWEGAFSHIVWFMSTFFPHSIMVGLHLVFESSDFCFNFNSQDYYFWRTFKLWKLQGVSTKKLV